MDTLQACISNANAHGGRFVYEGTSRHDPRGLMESVVFGLDMEQASLLTVGDAINVADNGRSNSYVISEMAEAIGKTGVIICAERKITRE